MIEQISDYQFPRKPKLFNSERRELTGCIDWRGNDTQYYPNISRGEANNVQEFHINVENTTQENPGGPVTLFTYANGVKLKATYYISSYDEQTINVWLTARYYDKDNNYISALPTETVMLASTTRYGATLTDVPFWFSPCGVSYGDLSESLDGWQYHDMIVFYQRTSGSPYEPINLNGAYTVDERYNYYGKGVHTISDADWDDFWDAIVGGGDGTPISPILPSEDTSEPGGGDMADPEYNPLSDPVDFPGLPTGGSAIASGFIRVYNPTSAQLQALAGKLWGNDFINTIHKIMNDPMEAMISLHSVPFQIVGGSNANIEIGNFDTEVSAKTVTTQYYTLNCGNISLPEHWASALDYSPYTTVDIFIPFVGVRSLQIDDVMGRVLNLKYNIDVLTGSAVALLKCGDSVLYTYNTQVHAEIPYTMSSYGRLVQSIISVAGTAIGATAGGAGAVIGGGIGGALGTAMTKHSDISRGGSLGGAVGVMGDFTPYLIIHRPIQSLASDFASKKGYPSNISATLSSVSGYTVVDKVHLTGIDCTDSERDEIHALLKDGVII